VVAPGRQARPDFAAPEERRLISQERALSEISLMSAAVMGFRWRPDGWAQVFYGPAGV
jgi:hypothetical protein